MTTLHRMLATGIVALTALAGTSVHAAFELVTNGGFETGDFTGWTTVDAPGLTSMYGVDTAGPHSGSYSAFFGGSGPGRDSISQTLATVAGQPYLLSFSFDNGGGTTAGSFTASLGGTTVYTAPSTSFAFAPVSFLFNATTNNSVLTFSGFNTTGFYTLDNVSIAAVPEPETYALFMLGLLTVGAWSRRRRG